MITTALITNNKVLNKPMEFITPLASYSLYYPHGTKLSQQISFYFHIPANITNILISLGIKEHSSNAVAATIVSSRESRYINIYLEDEDSSNYSSDNNSVILKNIKDQQYKKIDGDQSTYHQFLDVEEYKRSKYKADYYESYLLECNGNHILATIYDAEHSRSYHRNIEISKALSDQYPFCLNLVNATMIKPNTILYHSLHNNQRLRDVLLFMKTFYSACYRVSSNIECNIDIYEFQEKNIYQLLDKVVDKARLLPVFQRYPDLLSKFIGIISDTQAILFSQDEECIELRGYCIGDIRWNNIFFDKKKAFIYDFSAAHVGNMMYEYSCLATRLFLNKDQIQYLLDFMNDAQNEHINSQLKFLKMKLLPRHMMPYLIIDIINIIAEACNHYIDAEDGYTINLEQIDSITNLLTTLEVEFKPYYVHPEVILSGGNITLYDFVNIHLTYLKRLIPIAIDADEKYENELAVLNENIEDDIEFEILQDDIDVEDEE